MLLRILIADDEPIERRVLQKIIVDSKLPAMIVGMASSGNEALSLFEAFMPDLIFMDIRMPGITGLEVSSTIKNKQPDTIIAIITAYDEFHYAKRAIDIHLDYFLLKPVNQDEVIHIVKDIVTKKTEPHEGLSKPIISPYRALLANEIARLLHLHYAEHITLVWLESKLNISQQYLSRTFKDAYHISIMDYLNQFRIKLAINLLANPEFSIAIVAHQVGIPDASYFGQIFKNIHGVTPTEYRNRQFMQKRT